MILSHLYKYREKRDFEVTPEPQGVEAELRDSIFVVQKHGARSLHYDLRFEVKGVFRSWSVPKGPSMDPGIKRLAHETKDHPLAYASFEGSIPKGHYGAGLGIIWDTGHYRNITKKDDKYVSREDALKNGHVPFVLEGKALKGGFALTRTSRGGILVKTRGGDEAIEGVSLEEEARGHLSRPLAVLTLMRWLPWLRPRFPRKLISCPPR